MYIKMNNKDFKQIFSRIAKSKGFENIFDGWVKSSVENIIVLNLQKSNFGNYYEMNIKVYIQDLFGYNYSKNKDIVKKDIGDVFRRQPPEYNPIFNLEYPLTDWERTERLATMFDEFIMPFTNKALYKLGILELAEKDEIVLLPAVKNELVKLTNSIEIKKK